MDKIYDHIIVGAGPTGLTLATYLKGSILIIDKFPEIGGCHRVIRVGSNKSTSDGHITEHGPRVYSGAYINFAKVLKKIGSSWDELFTPYKFSITNLGNEGLPFTFSEYLQLAPHFFMEGKYPIGDVVKNFSEKSKDFVQRLCLLTDGAP